MADIQYGDRYLAVGGTHVDTAVPAARSAAQDGGGRSKTPARNVRVEPRLA